jgi:hypothetical protein
VVSYTKTNILDRVVKIQNDYKDDKETTLFSVMRNLMINAGCIDQYDGWSDSFSRKEISTSMKLIEKVLTALDLTSLSNDELIDIGFRWWGVGSELNDGGEVSDSDREVLKKWEGFDILLIPIYALPAIPKGTTLYDINLREMIVGKDALDNDVRMGMTAQGFKRKKE